MEPSQQGANLKKAICVLLRGLREFNVSRENYNARQKEIKIHIKVGPEKLPSYCKSSGKLQLQHSFWSSPPAAPSCFHTSLSQTTNTQPLSVYLWLILGLQELPFYSVNKLFSALLQSTWPSRRLHSLLSLSHQWLVRFYLPSWKALPFFEMFPCLF